MEPFGEESVQLLMAEKDLICILGNHERWALDHRHRQKDVRRFFEPCNISDYFGGGAELSRESLVWPATLPRIGRPSWRAFAWRCGTPGRARTWRASRRRGPARGCGTVCWSRPTPKS